jgi:hypothetical protein
MRRLFLGTVVNPTRSHTVEILHDAALGVGTDGRIAFVHANVSRLCVGGPRPGDVREVNEWLESDDVDVSLRFPFFP